MPEQSKTGSGAPCISFTEQDLLDFSAASGDRNPLHLSPEYARGTPYGECVVFGCLGAIACLSQIRLPRRYRVKHLEAEFLRPMFAGVEYRIETQENGLTWNTRLLDGNRPVASFALVAETSGDNDKLEAIGGEGLFEHSAALARSEESIAPGFLVSGRYRCDGKVLAQLPARWGFLDPLVTTVLCWGSYLVGMELPGESALFSRLVMDFFNGSPRTGTMSYQASVQSVNSRLGLVEMDVALLDDGSAVASGQCWSYIRPSLPELEEIDYSATSDSLAGRVALVLGSSRGLGAAMKRALELRGAVVFGMARSGDMANQLRTDAGDVSDPAALRRLRERICNEYGRLDFLICNAFPSVLPLRLEPNSALRIGAYIRNAVALTLTPLCEFLELLNRNKGCALIVSSAAVDTPVREWPHYVAAKKAVEGVASVACLQYPGVSTLIVRPPKLLTAMTNTPMGRIGALSPGLVASRIIDRLEKFCEPGKTEVVSLAGEQAGDSA